MKKNIFKSLMLAAVVSTVGIGSVYAEDTAYEVQSKNVTDYKLELRSNSESDVGNSSALYVSGIKTSKINSYYIKYVNKDTAKPAEISKNDLNKNSGNKYENYQQLSETKEGKYVITNQDQAYIYGQDQYAYIYNCTKTTDYTIYCSVTTDTPIKVERESMLGLSKRYKYFFFDASLNTEPHISVFPLFPVPSAKEEDIKLNTKVGLIEDSSVIKAMAKNEAGAQEKLYNYAKNATNGKTYSGKLSEFYDVPFTDFMVQENKYYYIFSDIEDPENKYRDVSDVSIVMGTDYGVLTNEVKYGDYESIEYKDYEYGCYACTNDYVWTVKGYQASTCKLVDSITSKGNCVKSVKTGVEDYLVPGALVITIGGTIIALLKKKTHFRKI